MSLLYGDKMLNVYLDHKNRWCVAMNVYLIPVVLLRIKAAITPSECVS
jgi:hypothetical protein